MSRTRLLTAVALATLACGDPSGPGSPPPEPVIQLLTPVPPFLSLGTSLPLAVVVRVDGRPLPGAKVVWTSLNPEVALVGEDGILRAVGKGTTTLSGTYGQSHAAFNLEVFGELAITRSGEKSPVWAGDTFELSLGTLGGLGFDGVLVQWTASPASSVTLVGMGPHATATVAAPGPVVVTARYGAASVSTEIEVLQPAPGPSTATLQIGRFSVDRYMRDIHVYDYNPLLRLEESAGLSGAWILSWQFHLEGVGPSGNVPVAYLDRWIPALGRVEMIDVFYGDPDYYVSSQARADTVSVRINYRDALGRPGTLQAKTAVTGW